MRRTWTTKTFLVRVVQINSLNASNSQGSQRRQLRGSQHCGRGAWKYMAADLWPSRRCNRGATNNGEYMAADLWLRGSVHQQHLHSH